MVVHTVLQAFTWKDGQIDLWCAPGDVLEEGMVDRYPEWVERGWVDPEPKEFEFPHPALGQVEE